MVLDSPDLVFELRLPAAFPLLKHLGQFIQPRVVEVKDLVLALSAGDDQLPTGAGLIAGTHTNTTQHTFTGLVWTQDHILEIKDTSSLKDQDVMMGYDEFSIVFTDFFSVMTFVLLYFLFIKDY